MVPRELPSNSVDTSRLETLYDITDSVMFPELLMGTLCFALSVFC